jgi:hypothetical protein
MRYKKGLVSPYESGISCPIGKKYHGTPTKHDEQWIASVNANRVFANSLKICALTGSARICLYSGKGVMFSVSPHLVEVMKGKTRLAFYKSELRRLHGGIYKPSTFSIMEKYVLMFEPDFWKPAKSAKDSVKKTIMRRLKKVLRYRKVTDRESSFFQMIIGTKRLSEALAQ